MPVFQPSDKALSSEDCGNTESRWPSIAAEAYALPGNKAKSQKIEVDNLNRPAQPAEPYTARVGNWEKAGTRFVDPSTFEIRKDDDPIVDQLSKEAKLRQTASVEDARTTAIATTYSNHTNKTDANAERSPEVENTVKQTDTPDRPKTDDFKNPQRQNDKGFWWGEEEEAAALQPAQFGPYKAL